MLLSINGTQDGLSYSPKSFAGISPSLPLTGSLVDLTQPMALEDATTPGTPDICVHKARPQTPDSLCIPPLVFFTPLPLF
jgi:hypothetical protein